MARVDDADADALPPPAVGDLLAVPPDDWAWLLPHVRTALVGLDAAATDARVRRLRASPASRLAGGRVRRDLSELLAAGGPAWRSLLTVLDDLVLPTALQFLVGSGDGPAPDADPDAPAPGGDAEERDERERRLRQRARTLKRQRDEARRRVAGAESRAAALERQVEDLGAELAEAHTGADRLREELTQAAQELHRAVERERRRRDGRVAELEEELRTLRRRREEEREDRARRAREQEAAEVAAARAEQTRARGRTPGQKLRPGRPTTLPEHVVADTTEAAELLLGPGRLLLVDGYNVTLTHRADLTLEEQRAWLVRRLSALASRRKVRPEVLFDGRDLGVAPRRPEASRGVVVRFSLEGVTADDEIELAVSATDEPVVVVTDDRGLRDRLRPHRVDLLHTTTFLSVSE